jgi:dynein heavy chain
MCRLDWFHGWPGEALVSVAQRFLVDVPDVDESTRSTIAYHMAFAHQVRGRGRAERGVRST